ncbi:MAG: DUF4392 domain-containing protein [Synergistaceae bacterium]|jgi:hypothetical protein|nr:DUF4392 domain-containing protein [Synergistaceae bacterium]
MLGSVCARKLTEIAAGGDARRGPSLLCEDGVWSSALDLMRRAGSAAIISGFYIPSASAPETDGPTGSVVLARALSRAGVRAEVWTDFRCVGALAACADAIGFPRALVSDVSQCMASAELPDLLVYVERLGRAGDGAYYDMRGVDVSDFTPPLDEFARCGAARVIGVGDGGNEVGMANYRVALAEMMPSYSGCLSSVGADVCVPADVSNWGAYALAAALSVEVGEWLAQSEAEEAAMLEALRNAGAVDGVTKKTGMSVDGFGLARHLKVCSELMGLMGLP